MNEPTRDQINQILQFLLDTMKDAKGFAMEQAPQVAQDIVRYGMVSGWAYTIAGAIGLLAVVGLVLTAYRVVCRMDESQSSDDHEVFGVVACVVVAFCLAVICGLMVGCNIDDAIKATFAPRLYVLDYVSKLVK